MNQLYEHIQPVPLEPSSHVPSISLLWVITGHWAELLVWCSSFSLAIYLNTWECTYVSATVPVHPTLHSTLPCVHVGPQFNKLLRSCWYVARLRTTALDVPFPMLSLGPWKVLGSLQGQICSLRCLLGPWAASVGLPQADSYLDVNG